MRNIKFSIFGYVLALTGICIFASCSSTKYVPNGEYLLDKIHISTDHPDYGSIELKPYVKQIPNYKMFGLNKTQLQIYNLSGKDSSKWINRQLKKMGEPPVIFDSASVDKTNRELEKFFINKGYINVDVQSKVDKHDKKADVTYSIRINQPYRLRNFTADIADSIIGEELYSKKDMGTKSPGKPDSLRNSLITPHMLFDRNILDRERERITNYLRNRGYYAFGKEYISYDADSSLLNNSVDLNLNLHLYPEILPNGMYAEMPHRRYYINNVFIYMDYNPLEVTTFGNYIASDSIRYGKQTIYYKESKPSLRSSVLLENNFISPGNPYSQRNEEITYSNYSSLQALNNISIYFEEVLENDSALLNAYILTMPSRKQGITYAIEGTNSEGDLGFASSLNYTHRNLFRGSENFNFKVRGAYESLSENLQRYYLELGAEASLRFPKFMFPFINSSFMRKMRASTEFSTSYNYQTRPEYDRIVLSGALKYIWQNRGTTISQHQFRLLDINYVLLPRIDSTFLNNLPKNAVYFNYNDQFIASMGYTYTHSTSDPLQRQRDVHSFRASIETAGNSLYLISKLSGQSRDENGSYKLFDTYYAQYVKGDIDYSKTIIIDKQNAIAWRIGGGICFPYGNSKAQVLPLEKLYYSGGANSVRAWSVRTLGPGSYQSNASTTFIDQSGNIKLDLNIEYRSRFFWKLEAAAFVDAGNIWTINSYEKEDEDKEIARQKEFRFNKFYEEIAIGYGLGLRLNFDFFLVRLDWGWKAYDPGKRGKDRWAILRPNFTDNFAWHVAVGYPF